MSSTEKSSVGERFKWVRKQLPKTQQEVADALQLSLRGYQMKERGETPFSPDELRQAEEVLGIRAAWLGTGTGEPFVDDQRTPMHLRKAQLPAAPEAKSVAEVDEARQRAVDWAPAVRAALETQGLGHHQFLVDVLTQITAVHLVSEPALRLLARAIKDAKG